MATEIAALPLREGDSPDDANSEARKNLHDICEILKGTKGFQRAYWGVDHETQEILRFFVDWDSVEAHKAFGKQDNYQDMLDLFDRIVHLDQTQMFHAHLKPHPPKDALNKETSPITTLLTIYFPADYPVKDRQEFEDGCKKLLAAAKNASEGCTGHAAGWIVEEIQVPGGEEKSVAYAACIGAELFQDYSTHGEPKWFKDIVDFVKNARRFRYLEVCHASLLMVQK